MYPRNPSLSFPQVSDAGYRANPMGAEPFRYPSGMPAALWSIDPIKLVWITAGLSPGIFAQATWSSPVFDLRPEFRNAGMPRGSGQGYLVAQAPSLGTNRGPTAVTTVVSNTGAVPIWKPSGGGGKLWVQTTNLTAGPLVGQTGFGFRVTAKELVNINDPTDLQQASVASDLTSDFTGRIPSALSVFLPPGAGYPVRYYRCVLSFEYTADITVDPNWNSGAGNPITIAAAYY